jgi:hypothetical protein
MNPTTRIAFCVNTPIRREFTYEQFCGLNKMKKLDETKQKRVWDALMKKAKGDAIEGKAMTGHWYGTGGGDDEVNDFVDKEVWDAIAKLLSEEEEDEDEEE